MLKAFASFFQPILKIYNLPNVYSGYYTNLENYILEGQTTQNSRLKRSMLLSHSYLIVFFHVCNLLTSSKTYFITSLLHILFTFYQIKGLQKRSYKLASAYVHAQAIVSILFRYYMDGQKLTLVNLVLSSQYIALYLKDHVFSNLHVIFVLFAIKFIYNRSFENINRGDLNTMDCNVNESFYSWLFVIFVHSYGTKLSIRPYNLALLLNNDKSDELKETVSTLGKSVKDLKNAVKARELFIASLSHELRNPLNCLKGTIEMLKLDAKDETWVKRLDVCKLCTEMLLEQVNTILDSAKINAGGLELHYQPESIHKFIERIWNISILPMKEKKINGKIYVADDLPRYLWLDPHRVNQILLNLIGNATKFAINSAVNVRFSWYLDESMSKLRVPSKDFTSLLEEKLYKNKTAHRYPEISSNNQLDESTDLSLYEFEDGNDIKFTSILYRSKTPHLLADVLNSDFIYFSSSRTSIEATPINQSLYPPSSKGILKIEITDTGCGMSSDALENIFQPFKQADSSIAGRFGGTGVGLFITKQIIEKMGGEIHVYSRENIGSCFSVLLPLETAEGSQDHQSVQTVMKDSQRSKSSKL